MIIDTHVHCRDEEQEYKETIAHALEVARDSGVSAILDMPNPKRPVFDRKRALERINLAKKANIKEVFYGTYIGLTANREQIKRGVDTWEELFPDVVGFKLYAGHSVGELGVVSLEEQAIVYETLSNMDYEGVTFVHAEKEIEMNDKINFVFDSKFPISHCMARPPKAEYESVKDQIELALKYGFMGKLHIAHVSHIDTVTLIDHSKIYGLDISCGVCPHHLMFDYNIMKSENGLLWKMNPPLREPGINNKMLEALRNGTIDWIETDHAPHGNRITGDLSEKLGSPFMSGISVLPWWPMIVEYLRFHNFSEGRIEEVIFNAPRDRLGIDIKKNKLYNRDRRKDYPFNAFESIEEKLGWH